MQRKNTVQSERSVSENSPIAKEKFKIDTTRTVGGQVYVAHASSAAEGPRTPANGSLNLLPIRSADSTGYRTACRCQADEQAGITVQVGHTCIGGYNLTWIVNVPSRAPVETLVSVGATLEKTGVTLVRAAAVGEDIDKKRGNISFARTAERFNLDVLCDMEHAYAPGFFPDNVGAYEVSARPQAGSAALKTCIVGKNVLFLRRSPYVRLEEFFQSIKALEHLGLELVIIEEANLVSSSAWPDALDLSGVIACKHETKWPVILDLSLVASCQRYLKQVACAGAAIGADGFIVPAPQSVVVDPQNNSEKAASDQLFTIGQFNQLRRHVAAFHSTKKALVFGCPDLEVGLG